MHFILKDFLLSGRPIKFAIIMECCSICIISEAFSSSMLGDCRSKPESLLWLLLFLLRTGETRLWSVGHLLECKLQQTNGCCLFTNFWFKFQILFSTFDIAYYTELIIFPSTLISLILLLSFHWKGCTYLW